MFNGCVLKDVLNLMVKKEWWSVYVVEIEDVLEIGNLEHGMISSLSWNDKFFIMKW